MDQTGYARIVVALWLLGMLLLMEFGWRVGMKHLARDPERGLAGLGATESAVFALFMLLIAFTFSGGAARFDARRQLITEETNDIGTAWLRLDLLPEGAQPALRSLFRDYVDSRLTVYQKLPDLVAAKAELDRSGAMQGQIWTRAVPATREPGAHPDAGKLLLPALNAMFDITTMRTMAARSHPPIIIYALLILLGLGCALLAGYRMAEGKQRNWVHSIGFIAIMGVSLFVILDMEYPRLGFIRLDAYDQVLAELRNSMK
jgi:hypothetical protein